MTPRTLTLQEFASLPPAWPESIQGTCAFNGDGTGILIAHVHPARRWSMSCTASTAIR